MVSDLGEDGARVELQFEAIEVVRSDQAVYSSGTSSSAVGTCEQLVLAPKSDGARRPFGRAVVNFQQTIV